MADAAAGEREAPIAAYLALQPGLFAPSLQALCTADLPPGSRVAVEKPFGEDLDSAVALNALLAQACGGTGERGAFRVDHFLGLASVQTGLLRDMIQNHLLQVLSLLTMEPPDAPREPEHCVTAKLPSYGRAGRPLLRRWPR